MTTIIELQEAEIKAHREYIAALKVAEEKKHIWWQASNRSADAMFEQQKQQQQLKHESRDTLRVKA